MRSTDGPLDVENVTKNFVDSVERVPQKYFVNKPLSDLTEAELANMPREIREVRRKRTRVVDKVKREAAQKVIEGRLTVMRQNSRNIKGLAINVSTWAEVDTQTGMCWGDWHVKMRLEQALRDMGHTVEVFPELADITIYLWGSPFKEKAVYPFHYNPRSFNVAWFYSHPDVMSKEEMTKYDLAFCLSPSYADRIRPWGVPIEILMGCTDMRPPAPDRRITSHDIVFIGNARGALTYGRDIIRDLDPPLGTKVLVFGHKWITKPDFNHEWYGGRYFPYERLPELYAGAKISLNDHHQDMAKYGFIAVKVFDILASGGFCITDKVRGMADFFDGAVPTFGSPEELNEMVKYYLEHEKERTVLAERGKAIASRHTYRDRAETIIEVARQKMGV